MPKSRLTARQKEQVAQRAKYLCEYCLSQLNYSPDPFSIEHIQPLALGGKNRLHNLAFSCQGCNGRKYTSTSAIDPITGQTVPLYHPRQHQWAEHFMWSDDETLIIGLTPIGRATIVKLELNREGVVNLRELLHAIGKHPVS
ncbi:MAG: HNH endonuclease [Ardenticatenaceae bacterium]|nr:HNH endonuclease [Ardenticatenaceae bacterium]